MARALESQQTVTLAPPADELGRASGRHRPQTRHTGWSLLGAAATALVVAGLVVTQRRGGGEGLIGGEVVRAVLIATWAAAGVALVRRSSVLGRIVLTAGAVAGVAYLAGAVDASTDVDNLVVDAGHVLGIALLPALGLHVALALPGGDLGSQGRRVAVAAGYCCAAVAGVVALVADRALPGWVAWSEAAIAVVVAVAPAHRRYLQSAGVDRQRLQWLGCAATVAAELALVAWALHLLVGWPGETAVVAGAATVLIPLALIAAATALVSRADRLLVTTVSITGLTGVVVGVYLVVVIGLGRTPTGDERELVILSMAAAGVAALVYLPARERLTDAANRLVYGERHAPDETIRTFGSRLSRAIPMDELLLQLAESLRKTMGLTSAEIWTGSDGRFDRAVSVPDQGDGQLHVDATALPVVTRAGVSGTAWVAIWLPDLLAGDDQRNVRIAPITHSAELLGLIALHRPLDADAFSEEDDRALGELARQVGLALHNVVLDSALQESLDEVRRKAGELQASRARIVATADAERRRIERNLHDGAQQHLVALAVSLKLTRDLVGDDPAAATEMLETLSQDVKDTIQELRDLAHGIYPPLLMDSGLAEALRAAASRNPLEVTVDVDVGRHTPEVEAAVYFCCTEAMQNAAKHAPHAQVAVRAWEDDATGRLWFRVGDDGPGFDPAVATTGHGFVNMNDRLGAIGGEVTWESEPGQGATVTGSLPVEDR